MWNEYNPRSIIKVITDLISYFLETIQILMDGADIFKDAEEDSQGRKTLAVAELP